MQTLLDNLTSIQWWLGVVLVGIIINLLTKLIEKKYDDYLSKTSTWWRNRSEKRKKKFENGVNFLKNNPQELVMASFIELKQINRAIFILLTSVVLYIIGLSFMYLVLTQKTLFSIIDKLLLTSVYFMATLEVFISLSLFKSSTNIATIIRTARK